MLYSHPGKVLKEHLLGTAEFCREIVSRIKLGVEPPFGAKLEDIAYLLGLCHDFGKATRYFQRKLEGDRVRRELSSHGFISALFALHLFRKLFPQELPLAVIAFTIIQRHHGALKGVLEDFSFSNMGEDIIRQQIESLDFEELKGIYKEGLGKVGCGEGDKLVEGFTWDRFEEIKGEYNRLRREMRRNRGFGMYIYYMLLYSALLKADRFDIVGGAEERAELPLDAVEVYMGEKFGEACGEIDMHRKRAHEEVIGQVETLDLDRERILSVNLPTGLGKTLTAFDFALRLRGRVKQEKGFEPRIIYTMPFLSIVDQNYEVIWGSLKAGLGEDPLPSQIIKHHHLAEIVETMGEEGSEIDKRLLLTEGWEAEVVVTTFVQLFHALFYTSSGMSLKFTNIANAIIILDEVQAIPHEYWGAVREMLQNIAELLNSYFIFLTATMPMIFERDSIRELVPDEGRYFNILRRTRIVPWKLAEGVSLEEFKEFCADVAEGAEGKVLIVANTVREAREIYKGLRERIDKEMVFLSTRVIPKHRMERIARVRKSQEPMVIVSTQLVEAGVDIDCDVAIRDLGPLDSINQVAGRCNRNSRSEGAREVYVCKVVDVREQGNAKAFYSYIYDEVLIDKTRRVLEGREAVDEGEFLELVERYYEQVRRSISDHESQEIEELVKKMNFGEIRKGFAIVKKEEMPKIDLFIEWDEEASRIRQEYYAIRELEDRWERKQKFVKIKRAFYNYVISVPEGRRDLGRTDEPVQFIGREELVSFYDEETGFIENEEEGSNVIL